MFNHMLVVGDGSSPSLHAARQAGELARAMGSCHLTIAVFHAPVRGFLGAPVSDRAVISRMMAAEAVAKAMGDEVGPIPGETEVEILEGPAEEAVPTLCETHQADLIVLGSSSAGSLSHLIKGDPGHRSASQMLCPMLVVQ